MRHAKDPNTQRDQDRDREIATMVTRFNEKGDKPITPLSFQKPKNQNHFMIFTYLGLLNNFCCSCLLTILTF